MLSGFPPPTPLAGADAGVEKAIARLLLESPPRGPLPSALRGGGSQWKEPSPAIRSKAPPAATRRRFSVSPPCSLAFTDKHHSFPLGRRRRQPKEAGLQEESPLCVIQSGTWLRPGAAASRVTEELCAARGEAAANSAPRALGCPGAWDAAVALLSGADSPRCPLRSGGSGQHCHTRSTPLSVAERG